jgi:L-2-hydroxyglutarate oxidase LhgO
MSNTELMSGKYDLVIVGGGISGAALLYTTATFTDINSIALIEKESNIGAINSATTNNSQTLHFGDIETNYSFDKAKKVKEGAEIMAGYLENHDPDQEMHAKRSKMALAVSDDEVEELKHRYHEEDFKDLYPKLRAIERDEIAEFEPNVVEGRDSSTELFALQTPDGYTVDYGATATSFVEKANEEEGVDVYLSTKVEEITEGFEGYTLETTDEGTFDCDVTVVAAGPHSLQVAKHLGYGEDKVLLPVEGSFFLGEDFLNGKVYTMQIDRLPFAAVHGDADVHEPSITRFGPTAKPVPSLERGRLSTVSDFIDVFGFNGAALLSYGNILADRVLLAFVLKNVVYELPKIGKQTYLSHIQKIVPSVELGDIERAEDYGGVRPQIVDTSEKSLDMGEVKIVEDGIIFNITPSPGASTSLRNAMRDANTVMEFFEGEYEFDEEAFRAETIDNFPRPDEAEDPVQENQ